MPYLRPQWPVATHGACAVHIAKIATGEIEETYGAPTDWAMRETAQEYGLKGRRARAALLTPGTPTLHFTHYNWCGMHRSLRVSHAMATGLTDALV